MADFDCYVRRIPFVHPAEVLATERGKRINRPAKREVKPKHEKRPVEKRRRKQSR